MKMWIKKLGINAGAAVLGMTFIGSYGAAVVGRTCTKVSDKPRSSIIVQAETNSEPESVKTTPATQIYKMVNYRKASVYEYDMGVKKDTKKSTDKKKLDKDNFKFVMPDSEFEFYDVINEPLGFTAVRSIANEYYTVNDIISGSKVTLNAHELICQMVYSEISDSWNEEAIKAQTVAAYSYLRFNDALGNIPTVGLKRGYTSKIENCVNAVEGQVMTYNGKIINAVYSASTAGYSTTSEDVWGVYYPYLRAVKSAYDNEDPNWGLEKQYTKDEVKSIIESKTNIKLSDNVEKWFEIESLYSGKYIKKVKIDGHSDYESGGSTKDITGITLCNLFDVKSNAMDISYKDGIFTFKSYGWGHGVGMSQWGACLYAANGWTYDQILTHYYVDADLALSDENSSAVMRGQQQTEISENQKDNKDTSSTGEQITVTQPVETTTVLPQQDTNMVTVTTAAE